MREHDDGPPELTDSDFMNGGCEPVKVGLVSRSEGFDAPEVSQRTREGVKVVKVECGLEGTIENRELLS